MKTLLLMSLALLTGCGTLQSVKKPFVTKTNVVEKVATVPSVVDVPAVTNQVATEIRDASGEITGTNYTLIVTPARRQTNLLSVTNLVTNVITEVNPDLESAISTAKGINSTLNPTPSSPLINIGLTGVSLVLGWWARRKTLAHARAQEQANANNELLETVITGVEAAKNDDVKQKISEIAEQWKVSRALKQKVDDVTRKD